MEGRRDINSQPLKISISLSECLMLSKPLVSLDITSVYSITIRGRDESGLRWLTQDEAECWGVLSRSGLRWLTQDEAECWGILSRLLSLSI